ncbi:MAG: FAD:protein FMN transferase [Chloroflexi bacterium]|nr:FAD:protein FMN transferase [Chloroflexota bacterium]
MNRREFLKITAVTAGVLAGGSTLKSLIDSSSTVVGESRLLMGTIINLTLIARTRDEGQKAVQTTFAALENMVRIFDTRQQDGPLARLNRDGHLENPPSELVAILEQSIAISELTNGAFDITVKPVLDAYQAGSQHIESALASVGYRQILISDTMIQFANADVQITLDGIAKGKVVDTGIQVLGSLGFQHVLVEAGGDLFANGSHLDAKPWKIAVQHPRQADHPWLTSFEISGQAVATSGDYMHTFTSDYHLNHIIDPRKGISPPELCSATVTAPDTTLADALGTAVMVMGLADGLALIDQLDGVEALLVTKQLGRYPSPGFPQL